MQFSRMQFLIGKRERLRRTRARHGRRMPRACERNRKRLCRMRAKAQAAVPRASGSKTAVPHASGSAIGCAVHERKRKRLCRTQVEVKAAVPRGIIIGKRALSHVESGCAARE